ncbi:FAD-dependent oxidoreductase [Paraglaciecola marina]|uniref:FAD-dependent oxidoreductase n=1 Tax=Paraglaciecola marina TaxID=2500157 RepID=UPI00105DAD85|nr:FAD-dependent oxidoreductase [Paraglaciecola marina]
MHRRDFIFGSSAAVAALSSGVLSGCTTTPSQAKVFSKYSQVQPIGSPIAPIQSSLDRVTRSIVGLRPFRKPGPRLEASSIGNKYLVHNYGHGGGGVSLSWGVAEIAAGLIRQQGSGEVGILGSGVIGLSTALELQRSGLNVTIYAKDFPPYTTSNIAGAMWHPVTLFEKDQVSPQTMHMLHLAAQIAFKRFITYANDTRYGVTWIRQHGLSNKPMDSSNPYIGGDALYPGLVRNQSNQNAMFGMPYYDAYYTLMIDPDIYLRALVNDFRSAGGKMVEQSFESPEDIANLPQSSIVNCMGLGAGKVFNDESIIPARGQLSFLLPQSNIDYGYAMMHPNHGLLYSFPRKAGILIGGSVGKGDWNLGVDESEVKRMVKGHAMLASLANS